MRDASSLCRAAAKVLLWTGLLTCGLGLSSLMSGCMVPNQMGDGIIGQQDMTVGSDQGAQDLRQVDMDRPPGSLGLACNVNTDCKVGPSPTCWAQNILDQPGNLPTTGGYCSSTCTTNSDCGSNGTCAAVASGQSNYCLETCGDANTCIHPQYACFVSGPSTGYCWPTTLLQCNPTIGAGTCTQFDPVEACIRRTYEDLGDCHVECALGTNTCPALGDGSLQHCVYINATQDTSGLPTRDKFKGTACFALYPNPLQIGAACSYFDECVDGAQCNLSPSGDHKCHQLCRVDVVGACSAPQTCKDVFGAGPGQPGLCM